MDCNVWLSGRTWTHRYTHNFYSCHIGSVSCSDCLCCSCVLCLFEYWFTIIIILNASKIDSIFAIVVVISIIVCCTLRFVCRHACLCGCVCVIGRPTGSRVVYRMRHGQYNLVWVSGTVHLSPFTQQYTITNICTQNTKCCFWPVFLFFHGYIRLWCLPPTYVHSIKLPCYKDYSDAWFIEWK